MAQTELAICAITFRRPVGLGALLEGLTALDAPPDVDVRVVIVDNDPEGSAAAVVDEWRPRLRWPIEHVVESTRGIPFARNRAMAVAGERDVVFIDDDEVPDPGWLVELLRVRDTHGAPVVTGPVLPRFEGDPPAWLLPFFERPRLADGAPIGYARTGNVLIARAAIPVDEDPFSPRFALTGGSDTHFFMRVIANGHRIVWADRATVVETMPGSRVNVRWLLRREYRRGNTLSLCLRDLQDTWPARGKRLGRVVVDAARGLALIVSSPVAGPTGARRRAVQGAQRIALAIGMLTGLVGVQYDEYAVIHGR